MSNPPSAKRKLDDVISALDDAVRPTPERPPPPKRTIVSIYATLAKYGIPTSTKSYPRKSSKVKAKPVATTIDSLPRTSLYRPSSLPCLLARLETFKLSTFSSKPAPIDSLACALAGWINDGKERILCGLCKKSWVVASVLGLKPEAAKALVERQVDSLVQEHNDGCPWKTQRCDPSLYSIPLSSPSQLLAELIQCANLLTPLLERVTIKHSLSAEQAESLGETSKAFQERERRRLARFHERGLEQASSDAVQQGAAATSAEGVRQESSILAAVSIAALVVALYGWKPTAAAPTSRPSFGRAGSTLSRAGSVGMSPVHSRAATPAPESGSSRLTLHTNSSQVSLMDIDSDNSNRPLAPETTILRCEMCFRRVPLWGLLQPPDTTAMDSSAPHSKPGKILDVVREHRHFCAYITATSLLPSIHTSSASSMEASDVLTGWEARLSTALRFGMGDAARLEGLGVRPTMSRSEGSREPGGTVVPNGTKEVLSYLRRLLG